MTAVHFGAGNIGRGFIGLLLHEAGHDLVFVDVNGPLIAQIAAADSYRVIEIGEDEREKTVTGFTAIDSSADRDAAVAAVASADIVTCAVGPTVLRFIAPVIADGLRARPAELPPVVVMACENALGATDLLHGHIAEALGDDAAAVLARGVFANTAVDRIVPAQDASGLDVRVEPFCEWAIESGPFAGAVPSIPGAHFVPELAPYIERKLFTVNAGHAACAYFGHLAGAATIDEGMRVPSVRAAVEAVLLETSRLLVDRHGFAAAEQDAYRETSRTRRSPTASTGSAASRCASSHGTSGSSRPRAASPTSASRRSRSSRRSAPGCGSTSPTIPRASPCSSCSPPRRATSRSSPRSWASPRGSRSRPRSRASSPRCARASRSPRGPGRTRARPASARPASTSTRMRLRRARRRGAGARAAARAAR